MGVAPGDIVHCLRLGLFQERVQAILNLPLKGRIGAWQHLRQTADRGRLVVQIPQLDRESRGG